jgi:hypothetical protein
VRELDSLDDAGEPPPLISEARVSEERLVTHTNYDVPRNVEVIWSTLEWVFLTGRLADNFEALSSTRSAADGNGCDDQMRFSQALREAAEKLCIRMGVLLSEGMVAQIGTCRTNSVPPQDYANQERALTLMFESLLSGLDDDRRKRVISSVLDMFPG